MKKFEEMNIEQRSEIQDLFANWLKDYSYKVIVEVTAKAERIINDGFAMKLLRELKEREESEAKEFRCSIGCLLFDFENFKEFNPHLHTISHASSYRDILYDMYIR